MLLDVIVPSVTEVGGPVGTEERGLECYVTHFHMGVFPVCLVFALAMLLDVRGPSLVHSLTQHAYVSFI